MIEPAPHPGIVALDRPDWPAAEQLVARLGEAAEFYKIGLELFTAEGPAVVRELAGHGKRIFLDLKLHDIPNTAAGAAQAAGRLGVDLLTVHAAGGSEMVRAASEAATAASGGRTRVVAVTMLTSLSADRLPPCYARERPLAAIVADLAADALAAGAAGLVCSGAEVSDLRERFGSAPLLIVPGTRPAGTPAQDQARVVTPREALEAGASHLVVGRAVTAASDPRAAWDAFWRAAGVAIACIAAIASSWPRAALAARVVGVVRTIQRPLAGVHVLEPSSGAYAATDSAGRFELALEPGVHEIHLAAVGYAALASTITVPDSSRFDTGPWLLAPLRPDGPVGLRAEPPAGIPTPTAADSLDLSLDAIPRPHRIAPDLMLELTGEERARWIDRPSADALAPGAPEGMAREILTSIATSDSISARSGGTGAPGPEAWRQWGDRLSALGLEATLAADAALLRRAVAYARTRGALAAGPTWSGYQVAKTARIALEAARDDSPDSAFLASLGGALDATFVPGGEPPKPKPAPPAKKKRRSSKRNRR